MIEEKYDVANDGKRFDDKSECEEYEAALAEFKNLKSQKEALDRKVAHAEYIIKKGSYIKSAPYAGGTGHDGYYHKCPTCGELVGGYEGRNTSLKVDNNIYKCEMCGELFRYS